MPLEIKPGSDLWYGRVQFNGVRHFLKLGIPIEGLRAVSLREKGDMIFEISRVKAQARLDQIESELREKGDKVQYLRRMHAIVNGGEIVVIPLAALFDEYASLLRKKPMSARYAIQLKSLSDDFVLFVQALTPPVRDLAAVTPSVAERFAREELKRGTTGKTYNNRIGALKTMFGALAEKAGIYSNPFGKIPLHDASEDEVMRRPFSLDEIQNILDAMGQADFCRPIIVTAFCTAMRRCDCCLLRYEHIAWSERVIFVKTAKGGARVRIPIFALLEKEIATAMARNPHAKPSDYIFPAQAKAFLRNPDSLTDEFKKVLRKCGFVDEIAEGGNPEMALSVVRKQGLRRASIFGIHSCRTTWITLAFMAGIPAVLIQKITGQKTVEMVLKHYFHPQDEEIRAALGAKLPTLLTGEMPKQSVDVKERVTALLTVMTADNWELLRDEALRTLKIG